jgi:hypothetical protein
MRDRKSPMTARRVNLKGWSLRCDRCGHKWTVLTKALPKACAKCKAKNWNGPPRLPGRPPKLDR